MCPSRWYECNVDFIRFCPWGGISYYRGQDFAVRSIANLRLLGGFAQMVKSIDSSVPKSNSSANIRVEGSLHLVRFSMSGFFVKSPKKPQLC